MSAPDRIERATPASAAEAPRTDADALLIERLLGTPDLGPPAGQRARRGCRRASRRLFSSALTADWRERTREAVPRFEHSDPIF